MPATRPNRLRFALPTMALGRATAGHALEPRLREAVRVGCTGVEVFYECLVEHSKTQPGADERARLEAAASDVGRLCRDLGLAVVCLQPLFDWDSVVDRAEFAVKLEEAVFRFGLCHRLGTDMMQIPGTTRLDAGVTGDFDHIARDYQTLCDAALKEEPPIRFAYEAMCFSTFVNTWQASYDIVKRVDRPNFGVVLDTYHIAGMVYADPTLAGGVRPDGPAALEASLKELVATVDPQKVFYIQIVDAERLDPPLSPGHALWNDELAPRTRMMWSRMARLFPYETDRGAYLPAVEVLRAILDAGCEGWLSLELFSRTLADPAADVPRAHADRAAASYKRLQEELGFVDAS